MYIEDDFSLNLVAARVNRNLTRDEAAKQTGVTSRTLANWEHGKTAPDAKHLMKLTQIYQVPAALLRFDP